MLLFDIVSFHVCIFVFVWSEKSRGLKILFGQFWSPKNLLLPMPDYKSSVEMLPPTFRTFEWGN